MHITFAPNHFYFSQNTAELKKDAGNTAISILGIVGGKGQVTGAKKMLDMLQQYPKTFAKRMFIELKKNFMRKLTWAPRTVAAMFKKDTWKNLYASLRKYLSRNTDEFTKEKPNRDLKNDAVKENVNDKKTGTNEKREKPDKVKTEPSADEKKASENYKKHENDIDDAEKKKLKKDADEDVPDGPDSDSKRRALFMAKVITEANDKVDTPVEALMAELSPLVLMKGVKRFEYEKIGDGDYEIYLIGSKYKVSNRYTAKNAKWVSPKQGNEGPGLRDHYNKHGEKMGFSSRKEYDESARRTIERGRKFSYRDRVSGEPRVGYWDPETKLFTATSQTRKISVILTHFPESWEELRNLPGFSFIK